MKIAIIDSNKTRGKNLERNLASLLSEATIISILGRDASGPLALKNIIDYENDYRYIFVHAEQIKLAETIAGKAKVIRYSSFYNNNHPENQSWIKANTAPDRPIDMIALEKTLNITDQDGKKNIDQTDSLLGQVSPFTAWHALSTPDLENEEYNFYVNFLKNQFGADREMKEYEHLFENDQNQAFEYARIEKNKFNNQGSKNDLSLRYSATDQYNKRNFRLLLIDDNEEIQANFQEKLNQYLLDNNEPFNIDVISETSLNNITEIIIQTENLQAIVVDDRLGKGQDIYSAIKDMSATQPNIPIYVSGSELPSFDRERNIASKLLKLDNVKAYEYKDEKRSAALFDAILSDFKKRIATPYFSALCQYSTQQKSAFHALPLTDGGSVNNSIWLREYNDFYNRKFFAAETSNTKRPLSSVFSPKNSLAEALTKAEHAFNADKTLFVSSGTTVSNLIVYKIHVRKGDVVLLDWNCHKSHHNAIVECGANVRYLKADVNKKYGISGLVSLKTIIDTLIELKDKKVMVKMISLTHPSFDGMLYDVKEIMLKANNIFPGIIFFFDEAWFAYGAFFPLKDIRERSAMYAANSIRRSIIDEGQLKELINKDVRVYATQSTHKTLSSIRQGSMIHIHDPYLLYAREEDRLHLRYLVDNAYESYITTSPNNSIIASLDVARMQAEVEGFDRINRAMYMAKYFRRTLEQMLEETPEMQAMGLEIVESNDLIPNNSDDNILLDPLKVTLHFSHVAGATAVEQLNNYNIQINKYSENTVLLLFSIGCTLGNTHHLLTSLQNWSREVVKNHAFEDKVPHIEKHYDIPNFHETFVDSTSETVCVKDIYDKLHQISPTNTGDNDRLFNSSQSTPLQDCLQEPILSALREGNLIAAQPVIPYPPGSPDIVTGQVFNQQIIENLITLKRSGGEIHGVVKNRYGDDCIVVRDLSSHPITQSDKL